MSEETELLASLRERAKAAAEYDAGEFRDDNDPDAAEKWELTCAAQGMAAKILRIVPSDFQFETYMFGGRSYYRPKFTVDNLNFRMSYFNDGKGLELEFQPGKWTRVYTLGDVGRRMP